MHIFRKHGSLAFVGISESKAFFYFYWNRSCGCRPGTFLSELVYRLIQYHRFCYLLLVSSLLLFYLMFPVKILKYFFQQIARKNSHQFSCCCYFKAWISMNCAYTFPGYPRLSLLTSVIKNYFYNDIVHNRQQYTSLRQIYCMVIWLIWSSVITRVPALYKDCVFPPFQTVMKEQLVILIQTCSRVILNIGILITRLDLLNIGIATFL